MVFILLLALGFVVEQRVTVAAFDRLEAEQAGRDAQQLRVALEGQQRLLANYGATNSIWDDSYDEVAAGDAATFAEDFPPGEVQRLYAVDGVIGVGLDGAIRTGGLVGAGDGYDPVPAALADPTLLRGLFDPAAAAGEGRCGLLRAPAAYLYCGFPAYRSDSTGPVVGEEAEAGERWKVLRRSVGADQVSRTVLDEIGELFAVPDGRRGPHGRIVVADAHGVVVDRMLAVPPAADSVTVGPVPVLLPVIRAAEETVRLLVVAVDRTGADLTRVATGEREPAKLTTTEALILQSFRTDYPVQGPRSAQFLQIGNAVPPLLAMHVVAEAAGVSLEAWREAS